MAEKVEKWYPGEARGKISYGRMVLYVLTAIGVISGIIRLFFGLGSQ